MQRAPTPNAEQDGTSRNVRAPALLQTAAKPLFEQLPPELNNMILSYLDDEFCITRVRAVSFGVRAYVDSVYYQLLSRKKQVPSQQHQCVDKCIAHLQQITVSGPQWFFARQRMLYNSHLRAIFGSHEEVCRRYAQVCRLEDAIDDMACELRGLTRHMVLIRFKRVFYFLDALLSTTTLDMMAGCALRLTATSVSLFVSFCNKVVKEDGAEWLFYNTFLDSLLPFCQRHKLQSALILQAMPCTKYYHGFPTRLCVC
jgi:hypothetical protein